MFVKFRTVTVGGLLGFWGTKDAISQNKSFLLNLESRIVPGYEKSYTLCQTNNRGTPILIFGKFRRRYPWWALERKGAIPHKSRIYQTLSELPLATGNPLRFARPILGGATSDLWKIPRNAPWGLWGAKKELEK